MPLSQTPQLDLAVMSCDPRRPWTSMTNGGANIGYVWLFQVRRPVTISQVSLHISVQSGNIDLAIYEDTGNGIAGGLVLRASAGISACPAAGVQAVALTGSVTLLPGRRYFGGWWASDNTQAIYCASTSINIAAPTFSPGGTGGYMTSASGFVNNQSFSSNPARVPFLVFS